MKALSPSAERICEHALVHFAERGYDGSSLNDIAQACDMRKASLYAHFASKDDIFAAVFERALAAEREHAVQCFAAANPGLPGDRYLAQLENRYAGQASLRFLLRTVFFPPEPLLELITEGFNAHLASMRQGFIEQCRGQAAEGRLEELTEAYLAIVDSLHVELIYGTSEVYRRRLAALRGLLTLGLAAA